MFYMASQQIQKNCDSFHLHNLHRVHRVLHLAKVHIFPQMQGIRYTSIALNGNLNLHDKSPMYLAYFLWQLEQKIRHIVYSINAHAAMTLKHRTLFSRANPQQCMSIRVLQKTPHKSSASIARATVAGPTPAPSRLCRDSARKPGTPAGWRGWPAPGSRDRGGSCARAPRGLP